METSLMFFSSSHSPDVIHMQFWHLILYLKWEIAKKHLKNGTSKIDYIVKIIWKSNKVDKIKK